MVRVGVVNAMIGVVETGFKGLACVHNDGIYLLPADRTTVAVDCTMRRSIIDLLLLVVIGSAWHFLYAIFGRPWTLGWFVPINESVWEHLKLGYGATLMLLPYDLLRSWHDQPFSVLGRALGIIVLDVIVVIGFYAYTSVTEHSILPVDIGLYVVGCAAAVLLHSRMVRTPPSRRAQWAGIALLIAMGMLFALWTYTPPGYEIFRPSS